MPQGRLPPNMQAEASRCASKPIAISSRHGCAGGVHHYALRPYRRACWGSAARVQDNTPMAAAPASGQKQSDACTPPTPTSTLPPKMQVLVFARMGVHGRGPSVKRQAERCRPPHATHMVASSALKNMSHGCSPCGGLPGPVSVSPPPPQKALQLQSKPACAVLPTEQLPMQDTKDPVKPPACRPHSGE
jgi:hypothetical protein